MFIYCSSFIESHTPGWLAYPVFLIISLEAYLANTSKYKLILFSTNHNFESDSRIIIPNKNPCIC